MSPSIAAQIYGCLTLIVILFQLGLAAGAPWGHLSMGGKFPGKYPLKIRYVCFVIIALLSFCAWVIFVRAGLVSPLWFSFSEKAIWGVVALNVLGLFMNLATPSKWERILWAPVTLLFTLLSILLANSSI